MLLNIEIRFLLPLFLLCFQLHQYFLLVIHQIHQRNLFQKRQTAHHHHQQR
jgi:hypothetical protein